MTITQHTHNVHSIEIGKTQEVLLISDIHFDHVQCQRDLLKNHLQEALRRDAIIMINGDFFCLMQGKGDPRRSKSEIRPEHNRNNYIDSVINEAAEWWKPYKDNLLLVGYGNHETGIIRHQETDALRRFVTQLNGATKSGGYGGVVSFTTHRGHSGSAYVLHYYHGSGGGGIVTKGVIQNQRKMASTEGYDAIWQGHVHELYHHTDMVEVYDRNVGKIKLRPVDHIRTSTYKEEYGDGFGGWHNERGAPPKPLGGYWMRLTRRRDQSAGSDRIFIEAEFTQCRGRY